MDKYNVYYTTQDGVPGVLMGLSLESVLTNVQCMLSLNDEITGIIDADMDN